MSFRLLIGTVVAASAVSACRSDRPSDQAAAADTAVSTPKIANHTFTATDYSFTASAQIRAGTTTIQLVNQGKEYHHVSLVRLDDGKTLEDLATAMKKHGPLPAWAHA